MKNSLGSLGLQRVGLVLSALLTLHCSSSKSDNSNNAGAGGSGAATGGSSSVGGSQDFGGAVASVPGAPGCGLGDKAAFCDTFDAPATTQGRSGEIDSTHWSAARIQPQFPSAVMEAVGIKSATIPHCRNGLPTQVYPDGDTLVCDPNDAVGTNHLMVAVAAQNYGQNSYRARQPFDFANRTGKIVFDADGTNVPLYGWVSVEISEDPVPGPGFDTGPGNDEGNQIPRNALEVQFQNKCDGVATVPSVGVRFVAVYNDYKGTFITPSSYTCLTTAPGHLNHFEVTVAQNKVEVYGSDNSSDGKAFADPKLMFSTAVDLPFTRGWVSYTTHNHATLKYSQQTIDSWVMVWDNAGFDGPVISGSREYEIPDSLTTTINPEMKTVTNVGYLVADASAAPNDTLHFSGVDTTGMTKARLAFSGYYLFDSNRDLATTEKYTLRYRFNGGTWRDRPLTTAEAGIINGASQGQLAQMADVELTDLVPGDNTIEFVTANVPQNYPPVVSNIDLILEP